MPNNTQNIALICHPYHRGGVTRWMVDMAVEYQKKGLNVYFITVDPIKKFISAGKAETIVELLKISGYQGKIVSQNVGHVFELSSNNYKANIYKNLIEEFVPKGTAIILSDDYAVWLGACAVAENYKIIGVVHCSVSEFYYSQTKQFINQLNAVVTVSNRCTEKLGEISKPVLTQPCGIPVQKPSYSISIQNPNLKTQNPKSIISWAGRIENDQKRVTDMVLIAEKLKEKGLDFLMNIIGEGSGKQEVQDLVKSKGLENHFKFHGWQSKEFINETLSSSHIYLLPSNYEGYPVAVMEAFANGCVVLSSRVSGIEDLELEEDTKLSLKVFDVGNVEAAANIIEQLKDEDFVLLKQKSKAVAYKYFSIQNCAHNYLNFISTLPDAIGTKNAVISVNKIKEMLIASLRLWKYKFSS